MSQTKSFRLNSKQLFLTYSQCSFSKDSLLQVLKLMPHGDFKKYVICRESHQDGNYHLHVYLYYEKKKNLKDPRCFDVDEAGTIYHPNLQSVRSVKHVLEYIQKDDEEPLTNMSLSELKGESPWKAIVEEPDPDKFLDKVIEHDPRCFVLSHTQVMATYNYKRRKLNPVEVYQSPFDLEDFNIPSEIGEWSCQINSDRLRCKLLIVIGPPGIGKTCLVRSFGPHVYIRNIWNLSKFVDAKYDYVVFDDMLLDNFNPNFYRSIFLGDGESDFTDKYSHKTTIKSSGKPCIILSNFREILEKFNNSSWVDQYSYVILENKLFL